MDNKHECPHCDEIIEENQPYEIINDKPYHSDEKIGCYQEMLKFKEAARNFFTEYNPF